MPTKKNLFRPKRGLFYDESIEENFDDTLENFLKLNKQKINKPNICKKEEDQQKEKVDDGRN